jgi:hypothetical protein
MVFNNNVKHGGINMTAWDWVQMENTYTIPINLWVEIRECHLSSLTVWDQKLKVTTETQAGTLTRQSILRECLISSINVVSRNRRILIELKYLGGAHSMSTSLAQAEMGRLHQNIWVQGHNSTETTTGPVVLDIYGTGWGKWGQKVDEEQCQLLATYIFLVMIVSGIW